MVPMTNGYMYLCKASSGFIMTTFREASMPCRVAALLVVRTKRTRPNTVSNGERAQETLTVRCQSLVVYR